MSPKKIGVAAAAVVVLGAGAVGGASLAGAAATDNASGPSYGGGPRGFGEGGGHGPGRPGRSQDTAVTGSERTRVVDAVRAKDSAVSVQGVRQDPDGSYDVLGTKGGSPVMLQVSKDLKTITEGQGGPGGPGGPSYDAPRLDWPHG